MNYAIVICAFVLLFAIVYWYLGGRHFYTGPRTRANIVEGMIISEESTTAIDDQEKGQVSIAAAAS
jgi:uncharacterized membrane protein YqiK